MFKKIVLAVVMLLALATPVQAMPWDKPEEKIVVVVVSPQGQPLIMYFTNSKDLVTHDGHITVATQDGNGHYLKTLDVYGHIVVIHDAQYPGNPRIVQPDQVE